MTPRQRLNILLADDGSQHAQAAVEWLQSISLPPKSQIYVFRAFNSGQIPWVSEFERALERTQTQLSSLGYRVQTELTLGHAAEKILEIAHARKPDLIVLGAKGLRSTLNILLGGVAQHVVEYASCPVLIVRAPYQGFCRILLVTDGSPSSMSAARYLRRFPITADANVNIMHVLPPPQMPVMMESYYGAWQTVYAVHPVPQEEEALKKKETKAAEALLARTDRLLRQQGIASTSLLGRGDAATEILDYAGKYQTDLIVAGSRGLSQFKSLWMGSVSRKLVHYAKCSVLLVKAARKE
ncbi:MAG TPA: universal stress protein [Anaerolineales bacterium]|jgi:nucleotide-binding universal stress UspA family protein|nr:universal stress protein [Anaerolineales bacterium]